ncbi:DUF2927 domain-containing protein [Chthonobacter albigriseus]|uniref:DUF2927 domain-containing protein n=1 Tax=Chthonobacter albigriseus TaxID=1683161 RepID=UPI0015EF5B64|nr:DUF2927 domain-containing protein [Chthonobacter albigriseus]
MGFGLGSRRISPSTRTARLLPALAVLALGLSSVAAQAGSALSRFADEDLARGFLSTVFGSELSSAGGHIVKKFDGPIRFEVVNRSVLDNSHDVTRFIRKLPRMVGGIDARLAAPGEQANFKVVVVDPGSYVQQVRAEGVFGGFQPVQGRCGVKVSFTRGAIRQATAVVVAGDAFQRCVVEEILQGLGPINDDPRLAHSVFNDRSRHRKLMPFDRAIVAMLYDPRVEHGMTKAEAMALMPDLIARARQVVR